MLILFITCISFIFFCKSLPLKPLPNWAYEVRLLSLWFWKETFPLSRPSKLSFRKRSNLYLKRIEMDRDDVPTAGGQMCLVDLPDLVLDCILERLQPKELCNMAGVSKCLREMSVSDRLWDRHMKRKWGRVIGPAALREWHCHVSQYSDSHENSDIMSTGKSLSLMSSLHRFWPFSVVANDCQDMNNKQINTKGSVMSWYLALETGKFWFPAQVYNREGGHVGFMLSCYDAEVCYDRLTDTFLARYPPHGRRAVAVEKEVGWDRLRAAPNDTPHHQLHVSDCLSELQPGDHIEIQWRRNKEFPYGWWYGIVGHMEWCNDRTRQHGYCRCHRDDTVVLEFNQYNVGSRWRTTLISRKNHREEGNETDGFYGGIRKLCTNDDISTWKRLWPPQVLE